MQLTTSVDGGSGGTTVSPQSPSAPDQPDPWNQQLAVPRNAMRLRTECLKGVLTNPDGEHRVTDSRTETWSKTQSAFEEYLQDQRDYANAEWCDFDHRFTGNWCRDRHGELCGVDRYAQKEFDDLHTVWMTLNGDKWNSEGGWRCPLDFTDELLQSNKEVGSRINAHLDNRFARFTVLGAHKHGYPHVHWGFYVEGKPDVEPFKRALHAHLNNSPVAIEEHHGEDAISIEATNPDPQYDSTGNDNPVTRLVHEASSQLLWPKDGRDVLDAPPHEQRFGTLLWALQYTSQWRTGSTFDDFCDAAQTAYMEAQSDTESDDGDDDGMDWDEFEDPVNPTVEIEGGWDTSIDPVDRT